MRIISGRAGGIAIRVPSQNTRPTTDRVRESLFSTLGSLVEGAKVLDLFAGSGSLGLECLSRGAEQCIFVDESAQACDCINKNLQKSKLSDRAIVRREQADRFLRRNTNWHGQIDLIFADPPYARDEETAADLDSFLNDESLPDYLSPDGLLILEARSRREDFSFPASWELTRKKKYGTTTVHILTLRS